MKAYPRPIRVFIFSAGILLLITASAKIISSCGKSGILLTPDPIFSIRFRYVFQIVGCIELAVAAVCIFGKRVSLQAWLVAWLATSFLLYRLGLLWAGFHRCSCLGNLTDSLHIPPALADTTMIVILAYLFMGSYAILFWHWTQGGSARITTPTIGPPGVSA